MTASNRFKIWHIANLDYDAPYLHNGEPRVFEQEFSTLSEAVAVASALTAYDLYLDSRADWPPVESNATGVMCWHDGEWTDRQEDAGQWICEDGCDE